MMAQQDMTTISAHILKAEYSLAEWSEGKGFVSGQDRKGMLLFS